MRHTTSALVAAALSIGIAQAAFAADLPPRPAPPPPPVKAPVVIPLYSWTGCYIGGNGGGVWVNKDYSLTGVAVAGLGGVVFPAVGLGGHDASSGIGGVQLGCNYQFGGGFVIGIQGDYEWMKATGSHVDPFVGLTSLTSSTKSLASVTGRIGYAWNRFLGYVKGGGAWERDDYTWFVIAVPAAVVAGSETRSGWTVGVGGEYAFLDWLTGFIEYDYYDFGTRSVALSDGVVTFNFDIKERKSVVKAGLNLKFGGGPVYARY
jgi:outer membrane immunogenic protein